MAVMKGRVRPRTGNNHIVGSTHAGVIAGYARPNYLPLTYRVASLGNVNRVASR
jgi:hypothetical protein